MPRTFLKTLNCTDNHTSQTPRRWARITFLFACLGASYGYQQTLAAPLCHVNGDVWIRGSRNGFYRIGDDENDFDILGMAMTAFEDTYLTILDVDGPEWTDQLRALMKGTDEYENPQDVPSERSWLLGAGN